MSELRADSTFVQREDVVVVSTLKIIKLCEWEKGVGDSLVIGVLENDQYFELFSSSVESTAVKELFNVPLKVVALEEITSVEECSRCDVIFFSELHNLQSIEDAVTLIGDSPVLLVGSVDNFLNGGGMIQFQYEKNQLSFRINAKRGRECGIRFRSSLLALAKEVIR
ncbi:YfiR family protein [Puniceicoccaceae bacterium K14]|nr:YfiR family protein [Puniceicoccaceae bacterium K14]